MSVSLPAAGAADDPLAGPGLHGETWVAGQGGEPGGDRGAWRVGEDLGVHLVQVHVPGDGLGLEGAGVDGAAGLELLLAAAGADGVRDGAVEVGFGDDLIVVVVELANVVA